MGEWMIDKTLRVREVSELLDVPAHVLSYWEREFSELSPRRDDEGRSLYCNQDVEVARRIRDLLYARQCTIAETKLRLADERMNIE